MKVSVAEAEERLPDLIRRAENGEEVVLTRDGRDVIQLRPLAPRKATTPEEKRALFAKVRAMARTSMTPGESAARSQDFLYDDFGLPK